MSDKQVMKVCQKCGHGLALTPDTWRRMETANGKVYSLYHFGEGSWCGGEYRAQVTRLGEKK